MRLSIIIPAYNEEEAIEAVVRRCLDLRRRVASGAADGAGVVDNVEILVVSDGSTDRTVEIARRFLPDIRIVHYEKNKGYGRAIKIGFARASGDLLSFLDADGTCDPESLIPMSRKLLEEKADICIGSRMGKDSKMPAVRRLGNTLFAALIGMISGKKVTDSASGIRVIRRSRLKEIYPLPNGMSFTPAMSSRAVLDARLKIVEFGIPYEERRGESKLRVFKDGFGFLKVIVSIALTYRPLRVLAPFGLALVALALAYGAATLARYLADGGIPDGSIHRLLSIVVFGVAGMLILGIATVSDKAVQIFNDAHVKKGGILRSTLRWYFSWKRQWLISPLLALGGVAMNYQTILSYLSTMTISTHWAYVSTGGYLILLGITGFVFGVMDYLLDLIRDKRSASEAPEREDDIRVE